MADLQQTTRESLLGVPAYLKRSINGATATVSQGAQVKGYNHPAIASVSDSDPNNIVIHDADTFNNAKPYQRSATLAHELTHRMLDNRPDIRTKPINEADPYSYDENNLAGKKLTDFSQEQLARMVEMHTAYANGTDVPMARRQQVMKQYAPIMQQLQQAAQGQSTINTAQPSGNAINTTPNAPQAQWDAAPLPVVNATSSAGPQVPTLTLDHDHAEPILDHDNAEMLPEPEQSYMEHVNQHAGEVLKGMGKQAASDALMSNPLTGGAMMMNTHVGAIEALKGDLNSSNPQQTAGKVAMGAMEAAPDAAALAGGLVSRGARMLPGAAAEQFQGKLAQRMQQVAEEAGVKVPAISSNLRRTIPDVADAIEAKATEKLKEISDVFNANNPTKNFSRDPFGSGKMTKGTASAMDMVGDYDQIPKDINNIQTKLSKLIGPENAEKRAGLLEELKQKQTNLRVANDMLDKQGLKGDREQADALFEQAAALKRVGQAHFESTTGGIKNAQTNPVAFEKKLIPMHTDETLHTALGPNHAEGLMDDLSHASRQYARGTKVAAAAKGVMRLGIRGAAEGAGAGAIYHALGQ